MTFEQFVAFASLVQEEDFTSTLEELEETLAANQLINWVEFIKTTQATSPISNAESVQSSLDELIARYGPIEPLLMLDLKENEGNKYKMVHGKVERTTNNK